MENEILGAQDQRTLDLAAKTGNAFLANLRRLAANVDQVAGVDDQRADVKLGPQLAHPLRLLRVHLRRAPHPRARGEDLEGVRANLPRAFDGVRRSTRRPQMYANALGHWNSLRLQGTR